MADGSSGAVPPLASFLQKSLTEPRILVVDDQPDFLMHQIRGIFRRSQVQFFFDAVKSSQEALQRMERGDRYLGAFLDFNLAQGDINGEELAKKMRERKFNGFLFSISTDDNYPERVEESRRAAGMHGVLGKPPLMTLARFQKLFDAYMGLTPREHYS